MATAALTDRLIRALRPREALYRVRDGGGLILQVMPSGSKLWHYRYELAGRERTLSIGQYPAVTLAQAREARDRAREMVRQGRDPSTEKRLRRAAAVAAGEATFEAIARRWLLDQEETWTTRHHADVKRNLEVDAFPQLGRIPVAEITAPMILQVLKTVERRGAIEGSHRLRQRISGVFVHAIGLGLVGADPSAQLVPLLKPVKHRPRPALTDLAALRAMLTAAEARPGYGVVKLALRLLALTAVRPGPELLHAMLTEFEGLDGASPVWVIPAERMKIKSGEHLIPLAPAAVEVVEALRPHANRAGLLFPSPRFRSRPLSTAAIGALLNRAGYYGRHVPHGWRAAFSTVMNERHPDTHDRAVIDAMLAHTHKGSVEAVYNRARWMDRRRELASEWADLIAADLPPAADLIGQPIRPSGRSLSDAPAGASAQLVARRAG